MAAIDLPDHVAGNPFSMVLQATTLAVVRSRDALVWWEASRVAIRVQPVHIDWSVHRRLT